MKYIPIFWNVLKGFLAQKQNNQQGNSHRNITFEKNGKSAYVIYKEGAKSIRFYSELGGGKCIFYIDIPPVNEWVLQTGYSLEQRSDILKFIADECLRMQTKNTDSYYKIEDKHITFHQK